MEAYQNPALSPSERTQDLLSRMTLREKTGQLTQRLYGFACYERRGQEIFLTREFRQEADRYGGIGALYGLYRADPWSKRDFDTGLEGALAPKARNMVQRYLIENTRLGIPALMTSECPHGHQALNGYLLPVNLASAASWSPPLLEEAAKVCGMQLRDMGVDLALASALDILRDPRWGRSEECFGEDPLLASAFAGAVVRGLRSGGVEVTAKHLCAQGETTGGVNASAARIGPRELREIHLPAVKACVEAGAASFMAAYNEIDGVYCHANPWLLRTLLREEYGFKGLVMSDGVAIDQLDAITGNRTASGALALNAGVDLGLWDTAFGRLEEAAERRLVSTERINEAAARVLELKFQRGLFDEPYIPEDDRWMGYTPTAYPQAARLAEESMILLKNQDGLLPLDGKKPLRILLTGPNADDAYSQLGDYTPPIRPCRGITVLLGLEQWMQSHESPVELSYRPGCLRFGGAADLLAEAEWGARDADVILTVLGGTSSRFDGGTFQDNGALADQEAVSMDCGENVDAALLRLPGEQLELLRRMKASGKPVVTILIAGRPYEMAEIQAYSDALFCCFYPGLTAGEALAKLLFGEISPSGRLPVSLPDHAGQLPVYYNYKDSYQGMRYYDADRPQYSFGCGLGYGRVGWRLVDAPLDASDLDRLTVTFTVRNFSERTVCAVPQLYLHRAEGVVTSRKRVLCDFDKVWLHPDEERTLSLRIPREALGQWDAEMRFVTPPGKIEWFLCDGGVTLSEGSFHIKESS